jgi:hypothetical protein
MVGALLLCVEFAVLAYPRHERPQRCELSDSCRAVAPPPAPSLSHPPIAARPRQSSIDPGASFQFGRTPTCVRPLSYWVGMFVLPTAQCAGNSCTEDWGEPEQP